MYSNNNFCSLILSGLNPSELVFCRKPRALIDLETNPNKMPGNLLKYYELLNKRLQYLQKFLFDYKMKKLVMLTKDREFFQYKSRDYVYTISPLTGQLRPSSKNIHEVCWIFVNL